jgi:biotin carboxyl carrier protein
LTADTIGAAMPALAVRIDVGGGETVGAGTGHLVLEAMKMENEGKAHQEGTVREIHTTQGAAGEKGGLLLVLT